jgi:hypothetical protein
MPSDFVSMTGEIKIDPPLDWIELAKWPTIHQEAAPFFFMCPLIPREDPHEKTTPDGVLTWATSNALVPSSEQYAHMLVPLLQAALEAWDKNHDFTGYIECTNSEGDFWRVLVGKDGAAHRVDPVITWPEV